jgi:phage tail tape-measure protein
MLSLKKRWNDADKEVRDEYRKFTLKLKDFLNKLDEGEITYDKFVNSTAHLVIELIPPMQRAIWAARDYIKELEESK